jgi:hypothetical protein
MTVTFLSEACGATTLEGWKRRSIKEERMLAREDLLAAVPDYPQYPAKRMRRRSNLHEQNTT